MAPFWKRLTQDIPNPGHKEVIWIHGVSVGEIKSVQPLFRELRKLHPDVYFLITTTTTTGQAEAHRSLPEADAVCYLPLDFPWLISKWIQRLKPKLFLLIETDFWPFLLRAVQKNGGKNVLISGKMSERSARRFHFFRYFSKYIFSFFDLICVQNEEYLARFLPLVQNPHLLHIAGNLKLDIKPQTVDISYWKAQIQPGARSICVSCTHPSEETLVLDALSQDPDLFIFLAPRHPERFEEVAQLLTKRNVPFCRFTELDKKRGGEKVILIDTMGKLAICYSLCRLAIVCGSFIPIGGHNIMEPCLYGVPVLFGPHMHTQTELTTRVLDAKAGRQVEISQLYEAVQSILQTPGLEIEMKQAATELIQNSGGAVEKTVSLLKKLSW